MRVPDRLAQMLKVSPEEFARIQEKHRVDASIVRGVLARVPPAWSAIEVDAEAGGGAFRRGSIQVLMSVSYESDQRIWIHVSACGRRSAKDYFLPSWEDMKRVKHDFIGPDRWAYQVVPAEKDYVNQNPNVLHLYTLLDGQPALPDFTKGTGTI